MTLKLLLPCPGLARRGLLATTLLGYFLLARVYCAEVPARPFVSPLFGEHMVLQRGKPNRVWGWTQPGAAVRVALAGRSAGTVAATNGRWQVEIEPPSAGGPYVLKVDGPEHAEFGDVLVGDVWLCGGQSNMEFGLVASENGMEVAKTADIPGVRLFRVGQQTAYGATAEPRGVWRRCTPEAFTTGGGFSAVGFYFGRKVHAETGVPLGLIQAAVGGAPAESWMSPDTLRTMPEFAPALDEIARLKARGGEQYGNYISHWYDEYDRGQHEDWGNEKLDDSTWTVTTLKSGFTDLGVAATPAVCWFRKEVVLPNPLPAGPAQILLGVVEKMDTVFINGRWTGASSWVENPRAYPIGAGVLRPGRNELAIRVFKTKPDGGFESPVADLKLVLGDGTSVALEGGWKGAVSVDARAPHPLPLGFENYPTMPTVLFLGMIRPLAPLAMAGAIWYQGEANQFKPAQYRALLPGVIADWRALFAQGDFPFYIVSLPAFTARRAEPGGDGWSEVREAQAWAARTVPNTGLAVTVDTGDAANIHPKEKQPVGERLALLALNHVYGREVVCAGPTFTRVESLPGALRIHFDHTEGGLVMKGNVLGEFSVAGADRIWRWADARIDGDVVVVAAPTVPHPLAVRYAWQANPLATLYNGAGLPAAPFRSDDWSVDRQ